MVQDTNIATVED